MILSSKIGFIVFRVILEAEYNPFPQPDSAGLWGEMHPIFALLTVMGGGSHIIRDSLSVPGNMKKGLNILFISISTNI